MAEQVTEWIEVYESQTVPAPRGAVRADVVLLGGGGAATSGFFGKRGDPGKWASGTIPSRSDLVVTVGGKVTSGADGESTSVGGIVAAGGLGATGGSTSDPGEYAAFGQVFAPPDPTPGETRRPGWGGITSSVKDGIGQHGYVWLRWHIQDKIENLHVGDRRVQDVRIGDTPVRSVYAGGTLVYGEES